MSVKNPAFDNASVRTYDDKVYMRLAVSHITKEAVNRYYGREIPSWKALGLNTEKIYYGYRAAVFL